MVSCGQLTETAGDSKVANALNDKDTLNEFLRKKRDEASSPDIDWNAKKAEWITAVEQLYEFLTGSLLKESIDEKTVHVSEVSKQITEEYIGTYAIPELRLKIGNDLVVFSPMGVNVVGAQGRVDVRGDRDTVTLIRDMTPASPSQQWKMVLQRVPRVETAPLDSNSLKAAFQRIML
jgi:hypothetical protein